MNCVILTAIRSGSTLLCNLLRDTQYLRKPNVISTHPSLERQRNSFEIMAPNPFVDPWNVMKVTKTKEFCMEYFEKKTGPLRQHDHINNLLKIPMEHYEYYCLTSKDRLFIEEMIPNIKFIWLERQDILARTISAYFFFRSKIPHIMDQETHKKYSEMQIPFDMQGIMDVYHNHIKQSSWESFLNNVQYHKVEYENLVTNPMQELLKVLEFLELPTDINRQTILSSQSWVKTERPESREYIEMLDRSLIGVL